MDAAVLYDFPHSMMNYILVIHNNLRVTSMKNNMITHFMMREAGIMVYDTPKIQVEKPTVNDHSIYFQETVLIIPLQLWRVLS